MKICILGYGPITNNLAQRLCLDSSVQIFSSQKISVDQVEVFDYHEYFQTGNDYDIIFIAWRGKPKNESIKMDILSNLVESVDPNSLIINFSSVAIYGENQQTNYESTTPNPINFYGHSKLDLENYLNAFCRARVCHLRISNVFGDAKFSDVLNCILKSSQTGNSLDLVSPAEISRDFISIETLLDILVKLVSLANTMIRRDVINISSGETMTVKEILQKVETLTCSKIYYAEQSIREELIIHSMISNAKLISFLDYKISSQSIEMDKFIRLQLRG